MSLDTQIECVKREVKRRKKVYPMLVKDCKMDSGYAELEISRMQKVLETLTQIRGIAND